MIDTFTKKQITSAAFETRYSLKNVDDFSENIDSEDDQEIHLGFSHRESGSHSIKDRIGMWIFRRTVDIPTLFDEGD